MRIMKMIRNYVYVTRSSVNARNNNYLLTTKINHAVSLKMVMNEILK